MFNFFKRKPKPETVPPAQRNSLFSTDIDFPEMTPEYYENSMRRVFRRTQEDFTPVDVEGRQVAFSSAMDANEGNVNGLKPIIEPYNQVPFVQMAWYTNQTFIGYQIAAIVAQHWLVDKACSIPGRDAMRHGYDITVNDGSEIEPKKLNTIRELDKKYRLSEHAVQFPRFNRIFGIRTALFKIETNDPDFYLKPFNIDGVRPGSYKGIVQVDPYWITPEMDLASASDPSSLHFYEPTWWRINGKRYHRSHLIIIKNGVVADILKPTYLYGGVSIPQKIAERVYAAERTANEAPMLAMTKRTTVWHMDVKGAMASQALMNQKLEWFARMRDNYGVKVMGLDDVAEQFDTSLADLDDVIMTQYQLVAAIADVPATKLIETSPKGFNATGEYESDSYHERVESVQTHEIQPLLERHYLLLSKSENLGLNIQIAWHPVDSPGAKEQAEINLVKAQTGGALVASGAIDGVDERARIIADKESGYNGIPDKVPEMETDDDPEAPDDDGNKKD